MHNKIIKIQNCFKSITSWTLLQTSLSVLIVTCKPIKDVLAAMRPFIAAENIKNCIGENIKTSAVHLK
jgi:hypothetical protein